MIHPKEIEAISRKVTALAQDLPKDKEQVSKLELGDFIEHTSGGVQILLFGSCLLEYNDILKRLLDKNKLGNKASEKYLGKLLRTFICEQAASSYSLEVASESLRKRLEKLNEDCKQHIVYLPLDGFFLYEEEVREFTLGKVCIEKLTEPYFENVLNCLKEVWLNNEHYSQRKKKHILNEDEKWLRESFFNRVCAKFIVEAEAQRAIELTIEKTQEALDLLKYAIPKLYPRRNHELRIGINGEAGRIYTKALALTSPIHSYHFHSFSRSVKTLDINNSAMARLEELKVFKISKIAEKEASKTELEEVLIEAVRWFSFSQSQLTISGELLYLTICLEIFLCPEAGEKVSNTVAEGVAFVLGQGFEKRKQIKERVKQIYALRSIVAHGRRKNILESDVTETQGIVFDFISKMTDFSESMKTLKDLFDWIEGKKLQ